jgi:phosphoribosylamine--glycine ligase
MKILFITAEGDGLALALRLKQEGNEVKVYFKKKKENPETYEGLIDFIPTFQEYAKQADLIIFDYTYDLGEIAKYFWTYLRNKPIYNFVKSDKPIKIVGETIIPYNFREKLESDRAFSHKVMEYFKIGEKIPNWEFKKIDDAIKFILSNPSAYALKVEGNADSDLSYVGITDNGEDVLKFLATLPYRKEFKVVKQIILEKKVEGIEIAITGVFNGNDWIEKHINFEHKKFVETPYAFNTGESGTILKFVDNNKLFDETLGKMTEFLRQIKYIGHIDVNGIISNGKYYPLEFTPRFGVPTYCLEMEGRETPNSQFFYSVAKGEKKDIKHSNNWIIGVVICGEGYPFYEQIGKDKMKYMPVILNKQEVSPHFHPFDVRLLGKDVYTVNAYVGVMTAQDKDIKHAQEIVYKQYLPNLKIPRTYYRIDIGDRVIKQLPELEKLGYRFE